MFTQGDEEEGKDQDEDIDNILYLQKRILLDESNDWTKKNKFLCLSFFFPLLMSIVFKLSIKIETRVD